MSPRRSCFQSSGKLKVPVKKLSVSRESLLLMFWNLFYEYKRNSAFWAYLLVVFLHNLIWHGGVKSNVWNSTRLDILMLISAWLLLFRFTEIVSHFVVSRCTRPFASLFELTHLFFFSPFPLTGDSSQVGKLASFYTFCHFFMFFYMRSPCYHSDWLVPSPLCYTAEWGYVWTLTCTQTNTNYIFYLQLVCLMSNNTFLWLTAE